MINQLINRDIKGRKKDAPKERLEEVNNLFIIYIFTALVRVFLCFVLGFRPNQLIKTYNKRRKKDAPKETNTEHKNNLSIISISSALV